MVVFGKRHWHDKYDYCKREQGNGVKTIIMKHETKLSGIRRSFNMTAPVRLHLLQTCLNKVFILRMTNDML